MTVSSSISPSLVVTFGEMLIDFVPDVAGVSLAETRAFVKAAGGAPANVACAIAKLDGTSAFIGKVGNDEFGKMLVDILKKNGVNSDGVCFDNDARTGLSFVTLTKSGEREFMFYRNPSADMMLKESELNIGLIKQAKIFHYGSISLISEPCRSAHLAAMKVAKEAGALLSYDPNLRLPLWPSAETARQSIMSIWKEADVIKVSDNEVDFLVEGDPSNEDDILKSFWYEGLKLLVITYGKEGCTYYTKNFKGKVKGYSLKRVDTTGAGDAFMGALLFSIAKDTSLFQDEEKVKSALTLASACGALSTTQKGAIPSLPKMSTALEFLASEVGKERSLPLQTRRLISNACGCLKGK
ncbi:Ribokinase [Macleaya cordata]|uniref:fructokinase n=1 Tax=Macleaya cordata TaxID=56857 RepID=A0A200RCR6_MACCD|nr:Ribokinase [Macleaya cordata]